MDRDKSMDWRNNSKTIQIALISIALLLAACTPSNGINLDQFMGPQPGEVYTYTSPDGTKMTLKRVRKNSDGSLVVRETVIPPASLLASGKLPKGMPCEIKRKFTLLTRGSQLVRKFAQGEAILLDTANDWPVVITTIRNPTGAATKHKSTAASSIVSVGKQRLFGKERIVIETAVDFGHGTKSHNTYASGIGLIRQGWIYVDGKLEAEGFTLTNIDKNED